SGSITLNNNSYFYSDGYGIYNKNHHLLPNIQLKSHYSSTHGVLMLRHEENDSCITVITNYALINQPTCPSYIYNLKIVNDTLLILVDESIMDLYGSEKITACFHANGKDIWLVSHSYLGQSFNKCLLTKDGVLKCIDNQEVGTDYGS